MKPGVYYGLSNEEYHSGTEGISKSGLDQVNKTPAHYFAKYRDPNRPPSPPPTHAQLDGNIAHCAILEPEEWTLRYSVGPDVSRATKAWKEFVESLSFGVEAIKPDQYATAWAQAESVKRIPDVASALAKGHAEVSAYWIDEETGVLCKCRPDFVHDCGEAGVILVDVKTCGDARPYEFSRMIAKHRYHVQAAFYSDGYEIASGRKVLGFDFVSVEMAYPYASSMIMLGDRSIDQGRRDYRRNLDFYADCLATGEWPGIPQSVHLVELPEYAFDNEDELEIGYVGE